MHPFVDSCGLYDPARLSASNFNYASAVGVRGLGATFFCIVKDWSQVQ